MGYNNYIYYIYVFPFLFILTVFLIKILQGLVGDPEKKFKLNLLILEKKIKNVYKFPNNIYT